MGPMITMIANDHELHYSELQGDFLRPPHGTNASYSKDK